MKATRNVYQKIKQFTDMKTTIFLVTKQDFMREYHNHGIRPTGYAYLLPNNSISLLGKNLDYALKPFKFDYIHRESCFAYLTYLIHDLRGRYMMHKNSPSEFSDFFRHLVKRSNHVIWTVIFLYTGKSGEKTFAEEPLEKYINGVDPNIKNRLKFIRENYWTEIHGNHEKTNEIIGYLFRNLEIMYCEAIDFIDQERAGLKI